MQKYLSTSLSLERCPHCAAARSPHRARKQPAGNPPARGGLRVPHLRRIRHRGGTRRGSSARHHRVPSGRAGRAVGDHPGAATRVLASARDILGQPTGSVSLSASAVDAMLKKQGLKEGRLYERIHDAVAQHLISEDIAQWAHQVSLDPNDSRDADERAHCPPPRVLSDASDSRGRSPTSCSCCPAA